MRARRVWTPVALLAVLLGAGCGEVLGGGGGGKASCTKTDHPTNVVVALFDVSHSTRRGGVRQGYLSDFKRQLLPVVTTEVGGVIAADVIDDNPLAHSRLPINKLFPTKKGFDALNGNKLKYDDCVRREFGRDNIMKFQNRLVAKARHVLAQNPKYSGTLITDALELAARQVLRSERYSVAPHKALVVFSDMFQVGGHFKFTLRNLQDSKKVSRFITAKRPRLSGVDVYVVGAGRESSGNANPDLIRAVERFWRRYFRVAGADLRSYGPYLTTFP